MPVTTHAGVWGATNDDGIRLMHEHGFMTPENIYVHAATLEEDSYHRIAATGGSVSVSTESEQSAGQGYPPTWRLRKHDIPVSLSMDTSVWWSGDLFCAMRSTLGADRSREHLEAHAKQETVTNHHLRAEQVVDWATRGGSRALGMDARSAASSRARRPTSCSSRTTTRRSCSRCCTPTATSPSRRSAATSTPCSSTAASSSTRAGSSASTSRSARRAVEETVEFAMRELGDDAWTGGMHPEIPEPRILENPYQYTEWDAGRRSGSDEQVRSERLAEVVPDVLAALHEVLERHRVTEEEWHAALAFLTEVGRADEFILLSDVTRTSVLIDALSHGGDDSGATASDVEGPLYVDDPPWREAPVKIYEDYEGMGDDDVLFVARHVTSTGGDAAPRGGRRRLADRARRRLRRLGRAPAGVQLPRAHARRRTTARYEFQTMLPKPYTVPTDGPVGRYLEAVGQHPWRPAHIHFKVTAPGHRPLITQVFFPDDPYLENDTIGAVKAALVRPLEREGDHLACDFDIALRAGRVSRFASCAARRAPVRRARRRRRRARRCAGIAELGAETPSEVLADPPLSDERVPLADVTLRPVIPRPGKVLCVGLNYKAHVEEGIYDVPDYPALFTKFAETLVGAGRADRAAARVGGRRLRGRAGVRDRSRRCAASPETRRSRRSAATRSPTTSRCATTSTGRTSGWPGKNWARSTPLGPFLVTPDEVGDPHALDISLELNGERMQASEHPPVHLRHPDAGRDDLRVRRRSRRATSC